MIKLFHTIFFHIFVFIEGLFAIKKNPVKCHKDPCFLTLKLFGKGGGGVHFLMVNS